MFQLSNCIGGPTTYFHFQMVPINRPTQFWAFQMAGQPHFSPFKWLPTPHLAFQSLSSTSFFNPVPWQHLGEILPSALFQPFSGRLMEPVEGLVSCQEILLSFAPVAGGFPKLWFDFLAHLILPNRNKRNISEKCTFGIQEIMFI